MSIAVRITFNQLIQTVEALSPAEKETLLFLLDESLRKELNNRRELLKRERERGELLSEEELFLEE
nr:hypothetical protein [Chloroflexota bacterium]